MCEPSELLASSRWYRPLPEAVGRYPEPHELPDFLESLSLPRAVLMPCADDWAKAIAELPIELRGRFPASSSDGPVIETLVDKWRFAQMLQAEALPHPRTTLLHSTREMLALPDLDYENMFLKPLNSLEFNRRHDAKAFLIKNKEEAVAIMTKTHSDGGDDFPIMLQEYIPGPPTNHYFIDGFVDRNGRISAMLARRRLRMFPPLLGNSTLMETVSLDEVQGAVETIRKMWSALDYRGIFSSEFKYDYRDSRYKILEVNARPWWYVEFTAKSGIDVCSFAYRDALEMPAEPSGSYKRGRRCVYLAKDLKAYRQECDGRGALTTWVRSWMGADEAVFCWDDPGPALSYLSRSLRGYFHRKVRG